MVRLLLGACAAALCAVATGGPARADEPHTTSGLDGWHSDLSHHWNPAHLWVRVGSPGDGYVMSGGRYHTNCDGFSQECEPAFRGTDWSIDVGHVGDLTSYLDLRYGGWGAGGVTPDNDLSIVIEAVAVDGGTLRGEFPGWRPACEWQQYRIEVSFWDTGGACYNHLPVGALWYAHVTGWTHEVGDRIPANWEEQNPYGAGTVYTIRDLPVGQAYDDVDESSGLDGDRTCSEGTHTHVDGYSSHGWGFQYEWHSPWGPDGYSGLFGRTAEILWWYASEADAVTAGQPIAGVGGGTTSFWMRDNPWRWEY